MKGKEGVGSFGYGFCGYFEGVFQRESDSPPPLSGWGLEKVGVRNECRVSGRRPSRIEALERSEGQGMNRKRQNLPAGMAHTMGRQGDDLLDDDFHPAALGAMARRRIGAEQGVLPDHAQEVVGHMAPRVRTRSLVANVPEGKRSRSRSVLISAWNCSWVA